MFTFLVQFLYEIKILDICLLLYPTLYDVCIVGCLDTLTSAQQLKLTVFEEEKEKQTTTKTYTKEDFSTVNRFESEYIGNIYNNLKLNNYNQLDMSKGHTST